ncbi:TPA: hypothetical protein DD449_05415 [Candidatus Berkelbacteria bacterium]|uniref:Uncharacterized protein n=1 Tax=Berkelbacteria bacterium GW2011_GWE1_39_12 TaxID=1618337 RepID=A0A0G4B3H3_9BACT|nr:MAG: hypothetical protein UT28_C0001G0156 [Berkelbacteria bacterium GW2011_GWE1_39_12]HBO61082.1 hypothetical protein [Candidatus Berkelbacteria bacterium]
MEKIWARKKHRRMSASKELVSLFQDLVNISITRLQDDGDLDRSNHRKLHLMTNDRIYQIAILGQSKASLTDPNDPTYRHGMFIRVVEIHDGKVVGSLKEICVPVFAHHVDAVSINDYRTMCLESIQRAKEDIKSARKISWLDWECLLDPGYPTT